jgi:serine/threonine protein phosphatase PrpC
MPLMTFTAAVVSDVGHVRSANQDAVFADPANGLWLVADGMGGHAGGEVASQIAITQIPAAIAQSKTIVEACDFAHHAIIAHGLQQPELAGMGTTLVAVQQQGRKLLLAWVGDSRIYHWPHGGVVTQVTVDHSFVQEMVIRGVFTPEEAQQHPKKNLINKALGKTNQARSGVEVLELKPATQGVLLLCTDGVSDMLSSDDLAAVLATEGDIQAKAAALKTAILATEASDNFSFILLGYQCNYFAKAMNFLCP